MNAKNNNKKFKIVNWFKAAGTSFAADFNCSYSVLRELFGEPTNGDDYKISTEWILTDQNGEVVTIYDWKETNLYDQDQLSVEDFRAKKISCWHVGAHKSEAARNLIEWIRSTPEYKAETTKLNKMIEIE